MFWKGLPSDPLTPPSTESTAPRFDRFHVTGLQYTTVLGDQEVIVDIQEATHAKRKFGPLTVNPMKDLQLTGVHIRMVPSPVQSSLAPSSSPTHSSKPPTVTPSTPRPTHRVSFIDTLPSIFKKLFRDQNLGFISRVQIHGLEIQVTKGDGPGLTLIAKEASLGMSKSSVFFTNGFSLQTPTQQKLVAHKAEWKPKFKRLIISGPYVLTTEKKELTGATASFMFSPSGGLLGPLASSS